MFKGILSHNVTDGRAARRFATVAQAASRSHQRYQRETVRQSTQRLCKLREREEQKHQRHQQHQGRHVRVDGTATALQASWTAAQAEALAQEDADWRARDPMQAYDVDDDTMNPGGASAIRSGRFSNAAAPSSRLHYDAVDAKTGNSIVQQNFDALVYRAVLHYGPPLPVEVVMHNNVISAASMSPEQRRAHVCETQQSGGGGADDPNAVYMDEVGLKLHELMAILRKEQPNFSVREDCDGVPMSLMVRNCSYLRAYGGKVNYMRYVRRLPRDKNMESSAYGTTHARWQKTEEDEQANSSNTMVVSLGKYKMREMPSQDGIRQGPQPWRYTYRML